MRRFQPYHNATETTFYWNSISTHSRIFEAINYQYSDLVADVYAAVDEIGSSWLLVKEWWFRAWETEAFCVAGEIEIVVDC